MSSRNAIIPSLSGYLKTHDPYPVIRRFSQIAQPTHALQMRAYLFRNQGKTAEEMISDQITITHLRGRHCLPTTHCALVRHFSERLPTAQTADKPYWALVYVAACHNAKIGQTIQVLVIFSWHFLHQAVFFVLFKPEFNRPLNIRTIYFDAK